MALAALGLALVLAAPSNWDSVPWKVGNPIVGHGALVVHDDGTAVQAFSATTRRFDAIGPSGSVILGAGDFVAVVQEGGTKYRAFSARRGETATFTTSDPLDGALVGDDVAVLVFTTGADKKTVYGYSSATNAWDSFGYLPVSQVLANELAVSRFVALLRTTTGLRGFSGRHGVWVASTGTSSADPPLADGNVAVARVAATNAVAAFSGVTGTFATSPAVHASNVTLIDHNVAFVRAVFGANWSASVFSAYDGRWVTSGVSRASAVSIRISDNVVAISSAFAPDPSFEAIGARPHLSFATYTTPNPATFVPLGADYALFEELVGKVAIVFSGITGGTFVTQPFAQHFSANTSRAHHFLAIDDPSNVVYGYSAATHAFTTMPQPIAYSIDSNDTASELYQFSTGGGIVHSFSTRNGSFNSSAPKEAGAFFTSVAGGSVVARVQTNGAGVNQIFVYDERGDRHAPGFQPGVATTLAAASNVVLAEASGASRSWFAYSVQRADWSSPGGAAAGAPLVPAALDDDVAWLVDSAGNLHAFGAHGDLVAWYAWPNDTEYQTFGTITGPGLIPASPVRMTFTGDPLEKAFLLAALDPKVPGVPVGGFLNPLCLDTATFAAFGPYGPIGPTQSLTLTTTAGNAAGGSKLEVWLQGAFVGVVPQRLGVRCEGIWIF